MVLASRLVLIADDDAHIRTLMQSVVEDLVGVDTRTVADGEAAVALAKQLLPDLILLDLMMPKLNGIEAIRRLRADEATRAIPVIAVTASGWSVSQSAVMAGCTSVVAKPFDVVELADRVQDALDSPTGDARPPLELFGDESGMTDFDDA